MDDKKLENILQGDHAPETDVNARKRAVNLAVAEFKTAQTEKNKKTVQGFSILSRLIGMNTRKGEKNMENRTKFIFGGAATAMALVLVAGLSLTQLDGAVERFDENRGAGASSATLQNVALNVDSAYIQAVETKNEADLERAVSTGSSAIPAPIEMQEQEYIGSDDSPLADWQREEESVIDEAPTKKTAKKEVANTPAEKPASQLQKMQKQDDNAPALQRWRRTQEGSAEKFAGAVTTAQALPESEVMMDSMTRSAPAMSPKKSKLYNEHARPMPVDSIAPPHYREENRDKFNAFTPNAFKQVKAEPVSTFSSDVDTASYSFVRKSLNNGRLPNGNAVRVEEMVNYFDYDYPLPESKAEPFKPTVTTADSPWAEGRKLMHIGIKGYDVPKTSLRSNIVFLLDVSGSMNAPDKLPLVKNSMKMLLDSLHPDDTVSIVTYAGHTGIALEPTKTSDRSAILGAMERLHAGGGTAGAAGIALAYDMAEQNFDKRAVNRVILATDGDFNVGITNQNELKSYIEKKREKGIFLSVLGFGQGNYNDAMMQTLAQNGNGIAAYIDNLNEARKVLVDQATSSLFPIAKDVKFQVEFNPAAVAEYRLIGYETRSLKREDFNNDKIDAGDIGAGHSVTAIYEFVPVGSTAVSVDPLRYGSKPAIIKPVELANEYAFLKMRYKLPMENTSKLITTPVPVNAEGPRNMNDVKFSTAVAAFGQILKGGEYTGDYTYDDIIALAQAGKGHDPHGYRAEFINLVRLAKTLSR